MTMAKKVKKDIHNLNKIPHPKGRKTAQLTKRVIKSAAREKAKLIHQMKQNLMGEKFMWFKNNLEPLKSYTPEALHKLIERYLSRFDDELERIRLKHNTGMRKRRQHANREDIIKMTLENDKNEYDTCGIEIPDIFDKDQLSLLRNWSGELRFLQNFKLVRFTKTRLTKSGS